MIANQAQKFGIQLKEEVFASRQRWERYANDSLDTVYEIARELGITNRLHLWPDKSLGSKATLAQTPNPGNYLHNLQQWWNRISEWPK